MPNLVPGSGNAHSKIFVCGEAPGKKEDEEGYGLCGPAGDLFWECAPFQREEVWISNVYKFRPPNNDIKRISEVCNPQEQIDNLWKEIDYVNPNVIIALGNTALKELTGKFGITKWRGSILTSRYQNRKVVGTIHTSNVVRESDGFYGHKPWPYIWKQIISIDLQKAAEESKTYEDTRTPPFIYICRDSMELARFLDRNKNRKRMAEDIESINYVPFCIGLAFDEYEAMVVPLLNAFGHKISYSDQAYIWQQLDETHREKEIVGQNFKYDQEKLEMVGFTFKRGQPIYSDTLLKAHTIIPELPSKRMEMLQSIWTKLTYHKDEGKEFNVKKDSVERLFHYNGLDAISTFLTDKNMEDDLEEYDLKNFFYDHVMPLHEIYLDMERVGFRYSQDARNYLKQKYNTQHEMIQDRLKELVPEFRVKGKKCHEGHLVNVAASAQIKSLIYSYLGIPVRTRFGKPKADEDTIVALLNNVVKDERRTSVLKDIIEDRRVRKTLGTYVLAPTDYDKRIRGTYRITGTETGRSSTAILKPPIRPTKSGHAFQTLTKHGTIGADIRTLYICDYGFVFVQLDLSQAEPRIVAVLSFDIPLLTAFNNGKVDIHRRTAALVLEMTDGLDLSEEYNERADSIGKDSGERFLGKKSRNGGNYNMGAGELATNIATDAKRFGIDVSVSEWRAGKMLENFHRESPNIRGVFHRDVQDALNSTRVLINPYGRRRQFFERLEKKTYGEGYAQIPQSTVADHVKTALRLSKRDMPDFPKMLMGEAHDALLFRFPEKEWEDRARVVKRHLETPIDFNSCTLSRDIQLKIPADVEMSGTNYNELRKVKI